MQSDVKEQIVPVVMNVSSDLGYARRAEESFGIH